MRAALASVTAAIVIATTAHAAFAEDKAAARAAYAEGTKYYDLNNFEAALKSFEKAYWNYEEPAFLYNIAQCYRQLDRKQDAVKFYRSYLRKVPDAPNRADVERTIATLESAIAKEPPPAPEPKPPATPSSPPSVVPATSAAAVTQVTRRPSRRGRTLRASGIAVAGVGVVGVGLGVGFALLAKDANQQFLHPTDGIYSPSAETNRSNYQTAEIVTFVIGGAALAVGTSMYLIGRRR